MRSGVDDRHVDESERSGRGRRFAGSAAKRHPSGMADASTQRNLVLILARDLTSRLATPEFVVDADGTLAYFQRGGRAGTRSSVRRSRGAPSGEWASEWEPTDLDGTPVPLDQLPLGIAFREGRPAHRAIRITGGDGVHREIEVTAFPLCPPTRGQTTTSRRHSDVPMNIVWVGRSPDRVAVANVGDRPALTRCRREAMVRRGSHS